MSVAATRLSPLCRLLDAFPAVRPALHTQNHYNTDLVPVCELVGVLNIYSSINKCLAEHGMEIWEMFAKY